MKYIPLLLLSLITFAGCDSLLLHNTKEYEEAAIAQAVFDKEEEEKSKQLTTAVVDVLKDESADKSTPHSKLALEFAEQDQLIEGLPIDPIPVREYIDLAVSNNEKDIAALTQKLAQLEKEVSDFLHEQQENEILLNERTKQLVKLGKLYEEEHKQKAWQKVWNWARGTLGIGGLIALAVLFPAIIPILGHMVGAVIKLIPSLASAFGVVAKSTADAVIKGVQNTRVQLKNSNQETYTREEVLKLLDGNLDFHQTKGDRNLIAKRKTKFEI